ARSPRLDYTVDQRADPSLSDETGEYRDSLVFLRQRRRRRLCAYLAVGRAIPHDKARDASIVADGNRARSHRLSRPRLRHVVGCWRVASRLRNDQLVRYRTNCATCPDGALAWFPAGQSFTALERTADACIRRTRLRRSAGLVWFGTAAALGGGRLANGFARGAGQAQQADHDNAGPPR